MEHSCLGGDPCGPRIPWPPTFCLPVPDRGSRAGPPSLHPSAEHKFPRRVRDFSLPDCSPPAALPAAAWPLCCLKRAAFVLRPASCEQAAERDAGALGARLPALPWLQRSLLSPPLQVVKVVGSNISHKLRLSRVKPTDEGTYECRVIDFSDGKARHHKVKAYLRVEPEEPSERHRHGFLSGHLQDTQLLGAQLSDHSRLSGAHPHQPQPQPHKPGKELKKRSADDASCAL